MVQCVSIINDAAFVAVVTLNWYDGSHVKSASLRISPEEEKKLPEVLESGKEYQLVITQDGGEGEKLDAKFSIESLERNVTLKLSHLNAKNIASLLAGDSAHINSEFQKSDTKARSGESDVSKGNLSIKVSRTANGRKTSDEDITDSDQHESKGESLTPTGFGDSRRLAAVEPFQAVPELQKTDKKQHMNMKSRVAEDIKDIAAELNKTSQSTLVLKKRKRDFRRENKWIEMKKYLEKNHRWPSRKQLKDRIRKGIPNSLRGYTWLRLLGADKKIANHKGLYSQLSCIGKPKGDPEPFRTIDRDVPRTFPENHFLHGEKEAKSSAAERLREVLYAYVHYDKEVQYCQGMNLVAAFLMISCPFQNEQVFWMLERLCHHPDYALQNLYGPNLELAFEFQYVLEKLIKSYLPKLYKAIRHADDVLMLPYGSINVFAPKWIISLWSIVPSKCAVRIWDIFFNEGHKILYRVALYVLKYCQKELLSVSDDKSIESGSTHI